MWRRLLTAAGFGVLAAPFVLAQPPAKRGEVPPGYIVVRIDLSAMMGGEEPAPAAGGGDGGGLAGGPGGFPGGPGGRGPGGPGGFPGAGGPGGFPGGPGGRGPGGFPGAGGPGGFTPGGAGGGRPINPSKSIVAVVPFSKMEFKQVYTKLPRSPQNLPMPFIVTDLGTAALYTDNRTVTLTPLSRGFHLPTLLNRSHTAWIRERKPQDGTDLVGAALTYGQVKQAYQYAEELAKVVAGRKDSAPPTTTAFIKAFNEMKGKLNDPLPDGGEAGKWQSLLGAVGVNATEHYALVHWGEQSVAQDVIKRKLAALESNFRAFYLWHALGGVALKLPERKLIVVLADKSTDMPRLREGLDGTPILSDAFFSPVHNLVVISPERMDDLGRTFSQYVQSQYKLGWNRDELLKGQPPLPQPGETVADVARVMTLSLVDKAVDEEATTAMVTREGTRQLYAATGVLNPFVILPEWVETGAVSLLNKPKGPYYHVEQNRSLMSLGLMSGYGAPNYVLVRQFTEMLNNKELNPKSDELLTNVLMDKYFDALREEKEIDPPPAGGNDGIAFGGGGAAGFPGAQGGFPGAGGPGGFPGGPGARGGGPGRDGGRRGGGPGGFPGGPGTAGGSPDGGDAGGPGAFPGGGAGAFPGGGQTDPAVEMRRLKVKLQEKSQATAWALTHFLAKRKMPALLQFYAELDRMPRDMRLDREMVYLTFCQVFGLVEANDQTKVDAAQYKRFADDWVEFMRSLTTAKLDIPIEGGSGDLQGPGVGPAGGFPGGGGGLGGGGGGGNSGGGSGDG